MANRHHYLGRWSEGVGELAGSLRQSTFVETLVGAVGRIVDFDFFLAFAFRGEQKPLVLAATIDEERRIVISDRYVQGPFLLDPFYLASRNGWNVGFRRLRDVAPDHFGHSEYYREHYWRTGIGDEISLVFPMNHGFVGNISFVRRIESARFSANDAAILNAVEPAIRTFCNLHWADAGENVASQHTPTGSAKNAGFGLLSPRERQIVTLILQGHSTQSIALSLDLSPGTVKIHRKNIHRKLNISTQAELFSIFMRLA